MNSRALSKIYNENVVLLAVGALFIIVAVVLINNIIFKSEDSISNSPCYQSVRQQSFLNTNVRFFSSGLNCPLKRSEISSSDKSVIKNVLADEMLDCWETFGKGDLELFSGEEGTFCHICSHIIVPDNAKLFQSEFLEYLNSTAKTGNPLNNGKTYSQLLSPSQRDAENFFTGEQLSSLKSSDFSLVDTSQSKDYAVVFWYIKGKDHMKDFFAKARSASPGIAVTAGGVGLVAVGIIVLKVAGGAVSAIIVGTVGWPLVLGGAAVALIGGWISYGIWGYARESPSWMAQTLIMPYDENVLSNLGCEIVES